MLNKIMIAASFAAITIAAISNIYIYTRYRDAVKKAAEYKTEAAEAAADLDRATVEIGRLRDSMEREKKAINVYIDAQRSAGVGYAEVLDKIDHDDACWLDDPIPDSVRDMLGAGAGSVPDRPAAGDTP